ncbi:MAG: hypothetical protein AABY30_03365 [Candidatus Thermoplasmatota archaeon]
MALFRIAGLVAIVAFPVAFLFIYLTLSLPLTSLFGMVLVESFSVFLIVTTIRRSGPLAVYENGIGLPYSFEGRLFVPFSDIAHVDRKPSGSPPEILVHLKNGRTTRIPTVLMADAEAFGNALEGRVSLR